MDSKSDNPTNAKKDENATSNKINISLYKYSKGIPLTESVILKNKSTFLQIIDGTPLLSDKIDLDELQVLPVNVSDHLSKAYTFSSVEEIKEYVKRASLETVESLFRKVKDTWKLFFDTYEDALNLCAAFTIFTYFQDRLGMTPYLLFVGDNNSGKSNALRILHSLAYRPIFDVSITPANIYNFLGKFEEAQGTLLEDEIDDIEKQEEKMRIYKSGYTSGAKITRIYEKSIGKGKMQQSYNAYCSKAFSSERFPGFQKAKGFAERIFPIRCSPGKPKYDILEVMNDAGDPKYKKLFRRLEDQRKLLLIYRMIHYEDQIPDIELSISNRDKQLCKPILRLFNNTKALNEVSISLSHFLTEKNNMKINSLDGYLYSIVADRLKTDNIVPNELLWTLVCNLPGTPTPNKPHCFQTDEFGLVSKTQITRICEDKFEAQKHHNGSQRCLIFKKETIEKLKGNYSKVNQIVILSNTSNSFNDFWKDMENSGVKRVKEEKKTPVASKSLPLEKSPIHVDTAKAEENHKWNEFVKASLNPPPKPLKPLESSKKEITVKPATNFTVQKRPKS